MLGIVAGVPLAVAVGVNHQSSVVGAWLDVFEGGSALHHSGGVNHLVAAV